MNYEKEYKKLKADIEKAYLFAQTDSTKAALEHILPELKESEDERTRKEIIGFLQLPHPQFVGERKQEKWITWLGKQGEKMSDPRYNILDKLIEADDIYQMSVNDAMVEEAKNKAIEALSKLGISKLFGLEKQGKETSWKPSKEEMDVLYGLAYITNQYNEHKEEVITRLYQDLKREFFNGSSYENMFPTYTSTEDDVRRRSTIQVLEYARSLDAYNQFGKADIDKNIAWLEKQGGKKETLCDKCRKEQPSHSCQDITALGRCAIEKLGRCAIENQEEPQVYEIEDGKVITYSETDGYKVIEPKFKVGDKIKFAKESKYLAREIINIKNGAYYFDELVYLPFSYQDEWELVEQKSADKVEPKFKVGDFIKHNKANIICRVVSVNSGSYYVNNIDTNGGIELFNAEKNFHLWSIADAKDGDVLAAESDVIAPEISEFKSSTFVAIYKEQNGEDFSSHCYIGLDGKFYNGQNGHISENVHPATKEQRDLLFQKMHEAGYEWDDENKELKHILE